MSIGGRAGSMSGSNRITADTGTGTADCNVLGQGIQTALCCTICSAAHGADTVNRRNVDDIPAILFQEISYCLTAQVQRSLHVGIHYLINDLITDRINGNEFSLAGIVNQHINVTICL